MTQGQLNPARIARATWRGLLLGFAFLGQQLRRLPGSRLVERFSDGEVRHLRVYSTKSSIEIGRLRRLSGSEAALVLRAAAGDLTISFASADDRDDAYAALVASDAMPRRPV